MVGESNKWANGGLMKDIGMKNHLHGPMDLPERKKRYSSSREEEDVATNMCPCDTTIESRTHIVGECEIYKEEQDGLEEEMRK